MMAELQREIEEVLEQIKGLAEDADKQIKDLKRQLQAEKVRSDFNYTRLCQAKTEIEGLKKRLTNKSTQKK